MIRDVIAGKCQQLRGKVKEQWGKLTDDDLQQADGKYDRMVGLLKEKYGYGKEKAEEQLNAFYDRTLEDSVHAKQERR